MQKKVRLNNKQGIFDLIEGYYISHLLIYLSRKGFFSATSVKKGIKLTRLDTTILQILYERTDIIIKNRQKTLVVNPAYGSYLHLQFHIDKFLKAYGSFNLSGNAPHIEINAKEFAAAFEKAHDGHNWENTIAILSTLKAKTILDLGCGPGRLAEKFCEKEKHNRAIGIDLNPHLILQARGRVKQRGLSKRIHLLKGNAQDFHLLLSRREIESVDVIVGSNIFNEFFEKEKLLVALLKRLRKNFTEKYLLVLDYYGILNTRKSNDRNLQHTYVHDMVQLFTGQGVPPENYEGWNKYYKAAGCSLLYVHEGCGNGVNWFVHIVQLG